MNADAAANDHVLTEVDEETITRLQHETLVQPELAAVAGVLRSYNALVRVLRDVEEKCKAIEVRAPTGSFIHGRAAAEQFVVNRCRAALREQQ